MHPMLNSGGVGLRRLPTHVVTLLTARALVVISSTCAILYGISWGVGAFQASAVSTAPLGPVLTQPVPFEASMPGGTAQPSGLTLEIQASPSVQPWVLAPTGEGAGVNPDTGLVRLQAAGASYSGKGTNPQVIAIANANGDYRIQLSAPGDGRFDLRVRLYPGADSSKAREYAGSGEVLANSSLECDVSISLGENGGGPKLDVTPIRTGPQVPSVNR